MRPGIMISFSANNSKYQYCKVCLDINSGNNTCILFTVGLLCMLGIGVAVTLRKEVVTP